MSTSETQARLPDPYRIPCGEVWGGIQNAEHDVCGPGICASLYTASADSDVGGDIHYLSVCESDILTRIAVADVMGHGKAVADVSQCVYGALREHMNDASGDMLLEEVNQRVVEVGIKGMTTAAVIAFNRSTQTLFFAYAGHHPVLVKRRMDTQWTPAIVSGPGHAANGRPANLPLAVAPLTSYTQDSIHLDSGDRLFLYTDGLIEAPNADGTEFGSTRLNELLERHGNSPLPEVRSAVLDAVMEHAGTNASHDDITLMVVEVQ